MYSILTYVEKGNVDFLATFKKMHHVEETSSKKLNYSGAMDNAERISSTWMLIKECCIDFHVTASEQCTGVTSLMYEEHASDIP